MSDNSIFKNSVVENKGLTTTKLGKKAILGQPRAEARVYSTSLREKDMLKAKEVMTTKMITVGPETDACEAIRLLVDHKISGLPVVDDQMHIKGIITEKDLLRLLLKDVISRRHMVKDFMTKEVKFFSPEDTIVTICKYFLNSPSRRILIVQDNKLVGLISRRDIIKLIPH